MGVQVHELIEVPIRQAENAATLWLQPIGQLLGHVAPLLVALLILSHFKRGQTSLRRLKEKL